MALQPWSSFYDEVLSELPKCSPALADIAIKRAAIEFCEKSTYHRADDVQDIVALQADYTAAPLVGESGMVIPHMVLGVYVAGKEIHPRSALDLTRMMPGGWEEVSGEAFAYLQDAPDHVRIVRIPNVGATGALKLRVAYKPDFATATGLHTSVFREHSEAIAKGAKARLMQQSNKPWTNPGQAGVYRSEFLDDCASAKLQAAKGFGRRPLRSQPV